MSFVFGQVIPTVCGICFAGFTANRFRLASTYINERPREPDLSSGQINPIRIRGETIYVSKDESFWFERGARIALAVLLIGMFSLMINMVGGISAG
jgi:hypothetical protein